MKLPNTDFLSEFLSINEVKTILRNHTDLVSVEPGIKKYVSFFGESETGKDTAALVLIEMGYEAVTRGTLIKQGVAGMKGYMSLFPLFSRMILRGAKSKDIKRVLASYLLLDCDEVDPFTDNHREKDKIRPLLEWYGQVHATRLLKEMMDTLPDICMNTRIYEPEEATAWVKAGGTIIEVTRTKDDSFPPISAFEQKKIDAIRSAGLVSATISNDGTKQELWKKVLEVAGYLGSQVNIK